MSTPLQERASKPGAVHRGLSDLPMKEMRALVADLFAPKPWIFWLDFLLCVSLGWGAFGAGVVADPWSAAQIALLFLSGCLLYRALAFIHELTHLRAGAVPGFRLAWNLLCGIPLLSPDFTYIGVHLVHHNKRDYGTGRDAEYLPFVRRSTGFLLAQIPIVLCLPLLALLRFGAMAPLSLLDRRLRRKVTEEMSAISMKMPYRRDLPVKASDWRWWHVEEVGCCLLVLAVAALILLGELPLGLALCWYAVAATITSLNFVRALGATHRYRGDETTMSFAEQFDDSVNVVSNSLTALVICPVGLRYHALHHLFPAIPYHNLGPAHRRLSAALPAGSAYAAVSVPNVWAGCAQLWRDVDRPATAPADDAPHAV